jgi:hypothetical protein
MSRRRSRRQGQDWRRPRGLGRGGCRPRAAARMPPGFSAPLAVCAMTPATGAVSPNGAPTLKPCGQPLVMPHLGAVRGELTLDESHRLRPTRPWRTETPRHRLGRLTPAEVRVADLVRTDCPMHRPPAVVLGLHRASPSDPHLHQARHHQAGRIGRPERPATGLTQAVGAMIAPTDRRVLLEILTTARGGSTGWSLPAQLWTWS